MLFQNRNTRKLPGKQRRARNEHRLPRQNTIHAALARLRVLELDKHCTAHCKIDLDFQHESGAAYWIIIFPATYFQLHC